MKNWSAWRKSRNAGKHSDFVVGCLWSQWNRRKNGNLQSYDAHIEASNGLNGVFARNENNIQNMLLFSTREKFDFFNYLLPFKVRT